MNRLNYHFYHQGVERISDITGKPELTYPPWKRYLFRYLVTFPVIFTCLLVVFASVLVILELQVRQEQSGPVSLYRHGLSPSSYSNGWTK